MWIKQKYLYLEKACPDCPEEVEGTVGEGPVLLAIRHQLSAMSFSLSPSGFCLRPAPAAVAGIILNDFPSCANRTSVLK
jgi:hypothetical protein